jgi:hypothetical protein
MYGKDRKVATKKEYVKILPKRMKANPKIELGVPDIKLTGNKAKAIVIMKIASWKSPVTYYLIKEEEGWSMMSWEY